MTTATFDRSPRRSRRHTRTFVRAGALAALAWLGLAACEQEPTEPARPAAEAPRDHDRVVEGTGSADAERPARRPAHPDVDEASGGATIAQANWNVQQNTSEDAEVTEIEVTGPDGQSGLMVYRRQPQTARAGEPLRYEIVAENQGANTLRNIQIREWRTGNFQVDSSGFEGGSASRDGQNAGPQSQVSSSSRDGSQDRSDERVNGAARERSGSDASWTIDSLRPGESRTIQVVGVAPERGSISVCMHVTYEPTICTTTEIVRPQLRLTREFETRRAMVCDDINATYTITNPGDAAARDIRLSEELPEGLTAQGGRTVTIEIPELGSGASIQRSVTLTADAPGRYTSSARVTAGNLEARTGEETLVFLEPNLQLAVDAPTREYVGRTVPIRVRLTNAGSGPALDTRVRMPGLGDLSRATVSTRTAEISGDEIAVGRIEAGETRDFTIAFDAEQARELDLRLAASAYCAQTVEEALALDLVGVEAVRIEMIDLTDPVVVGDSTTYEIQVKNQGTADSINVRLTAVLPDEMRFVEGEGDTRVTGDGGEIRFAPLGRLRPTEVATWRVTVSAEDAAKTQMELRLQSDATKRPVVEYEPTTIIGQPAGGRPQRGDQ